jgi:Phage integrase family.
MARPLELEPYRLSSGKWQVNVVAQLSPTSKRQRLQFGNKQAALSHIEELKARRDNIAAVNRALSPAQLLDAASAFELLADHPTATLSEAARVYLDAIKTRVASISLEELFRRFTAAKKHKSKFYLRDIKWVCDRLKPLHPKLVSDITRAELAALLGPLPDSSRNNMLRNLRALFRYGHDLGYLKEVPIRRNDFVEIKRSEIDVLPVAKVRRLLEAALFHDPELLPLLLIETFCGVRPEEAVRVLWSDLDFVRKRLTIRAAISKTGTARPIELAPCALSWFQVCPKTTTGPIAPWPETVLRSKMREVRYLAGYRGAGAKWTPGALRDAFCSYHLAHYGSIGRLITESGHTNLRTTKDHYLGLVSKEAAAEFWNLFPATTGGKVVPFSKAS